MYGQYNKGIILKKKLIVYFIFLHAGSSDFGKGKGKDRW